MIPGKKLRVLVVDDSVVYRTMVSDVLSQLEGVEVVGTAHHGRAAMAKMTALQPDLLTLDIEMPEMDGLEVLTEMAARFPQVGAIMISAFAGEGGEKNIQALERGAFDFVLKPREGSSDKNKEKLRQGLAPIVRSFCRMQAIRSILGKTDRKGTGASPSPSAKTVQNISPVRVFPDRGQMKSRVVAIGVSTGGPRALGTVLSGIPSDMGVPILIVQHMPPLFTHALAQSLNQKSMIQVREAREGDVLAPNTAYIAPGGRQMKVVSQGAGKELMIRITDDPPENGCRPSADYLFRSVAAHFGAKATGVIMTGMGHDGADGLKRMKDKGAMIIAQDEKSSTVFGMATRPIAWKIVDVVAPLERLSVEIIKTVR